jgi:hypothetical protein
MALKFIHASMKKMMLMNTLPSPKDALNIYMKDAWKILLK